MRRPGLVLPFADREPNGRAGPHLATRPRHVAKYVSWIDRVEKVLVGDIGLRLIIGVGVIQAAVGDYPPRLFFFEPYKIGDYSGMRRILDARVLSRVGWV